MAIGILAYGSLISTPGSEIGPLIRGVTTKGTDFEVEFARSSTGRNGAPTLVPVEEGGAYVNAFLLILDDSVSVEAAEDMLYRRETNQVGSGKPYPRDREPKPGRVLIERIHGLVIADPVLYTRIDADLMGAPADRLADLAIASARAEAGVCGRDGITYLRDAKIAGISTPLMSEYEAEILKKTDTSTLDEALRQVAKRNR